MSWFPDIGVTPYYEDEAVVIFHGDCREILPLLPNDTVAFVLTDPPWGVNHEATHRSDGSKRWGNERVVGDNVPFDPTFLLDFKKLIIWGANNFASRLPDSAGWIVWNKSPNGAKQGFIYSHSELAWTNLSNHIENIDFTWEGNSRQGEPFLHPTQKPVGVMRLLIERYSKAGDIILDPFIGSGTTAQAARECRRKCIGIEIEEKYCEIAAKRMAQTVMQL